MGLSSSIQFWNAAAVMQAYNNRQVDAWSINCGKQFMFKGIGADELQQILDQLELSNSNATYTLKIYEDIEDEKKIKSNTADDGSFNFKFNTELQNRYTALRQSGLNPGEENVILSKLAAIEKRLDEEEEEENENDYGLGKIGRILEHPTIQQIAPTIIQKIIAAILPPEKNPALQNSIGAINPESEEIMLIECIHTLKKYDPDLLIHLQKLLAIAENNPETFKMLIGSLN